MSSLRSSSFLPKLILSSLNVLLFLVSAASLAPLFVIRNPPTPFGWSIAVTSCLTLFTSFLGFYSYLFHCCFSIHISFLCSSILGQLLGFFSFNLKEDESLQMLESQRSDRETRILFKIEEASLLVMMLLSMLVMVLSCAVQRCWLREFEVMEAEKEAAAKRRWRKTARVQEESMVNVAVEEEVDEKVTVKHGEWDKINLAA